MSIINSSTENKQLYSAAENAPDFDRDRAALLSQWLQTCLPIEKSLDIGCSSGGFSSLLPEDVEKWGMDFERHPQLPENFNFRSGDFSQAWQVPQIYFDVV